MSAIRATGGKILDSKIVSKILRTHLAIYGIKVLIIQEVRAMPGNDLTLDGLVGWLIAF